MKKAIGIFLLPFLYVRYSFLIIVPVALYGFIKHYDINTVRVLILGCFMIFTFATMTLSLLFMKYWTKFLIKIFNIEYNTDSNWMPPMAHSGSVWCHHVLEVNNKKFNITTTSSSSYDEDVSIRRKAIFYYLFF